MNKKSVITAVFVGLVASIAFILIQPLLGMTTLTSGHADVYANHAFYSATAAMTLSWFLHISVSITYALLSTLIFNFNSSLLMNSAQVVVLGWLTTLIATPANEFVVKLVITEQFPILRSLSALNTEIGPKLWLHMMFFVLVMSGLCLTRKYLPKIFPAE
ncbi:MAG: hypothetical protein WBM99_13960 [Psychromonas sp.]